MYSKELRDELSDLANSDLYRKLKRVESDQSARISIGGKEYISLCSNNYLGFANHPAIKDASIEAIREFGNSTAASRLISGNMAIHERLEKITAEFKGTEDALVFNCGYMANIGVIPALTDERDAIFSDEFNHASIIDGCRLSRAKVFIYNHCNSEHLKSLLSQAPGYRRRIIITDSVFSMDGDIAPLPDIIKIAKEYNAMVIVDDAHATGVLGKKGRGSFEYFGITDKNHIQMGTYSKALGSFGAYISGSKEVKDYLINKARSFIYTTALPPSIIAASIAAINLLNEDRGILERLNENTRLFREGLRGLGFNTLNSATPIIPILTGTVEDTVSFSERLFEGGIYAAPIRPPTVPEGKCRIRTTITAVHSTSEIELCLKAFEKVGKGLKII